MTEGAAGTLDDAVVAFMLSRAACGATMATRRTYTTDLDAFCRFAGPMLVTSLTTETVERHLAALRARMQPVSAHRHYRTLRAFCRWLVRTGRLEADPMRGLVMRVPGTLPRVPSDADVRRLLAACPNTPEGRRNRALIGLAADSGLRMEELRRLRVGEADLAARMIQVRAGKGQRDGVAFFGEATTSLLRAWLAVHPDPRPPAFLFVARGGVQLGPWGIVRVLHRLSRRAKLERPIGPHALRHYAATTILRRTGDLELVRRVLRHSTLAMALRYATLTQTEIAAKFERASPLDHLWGWRASPTFRTRGTSEAP